MSTLTREEAQMEASNAIYAHCGVERGSAIIRELKRLDSDCAVCGDLHPADVICVACGVPCCASAMDEDWRDTCRHCGAWARQHDPSHACPECAATHGGCGCGR